MAEIISTIGSGGHYTTITAWLAASDANGDSLDTTGGTVTVDFTADNVYVGELLNDITVSQSTTNGQGAVNIEGAPTTSTSYRILRSQVGGPRRTIQITSFANNANPERMVLINLDEAHSRLTDIEARITGFPGGTGNWANNTALFYYNNGWGFLRCVARDTNQTEAGATGNRSVRGFLTQTSNDYHVVRCVAYGLVASGSGSARGFLLTKGIAGTSRVINNTWHGAAQRGFDVSTSHASAVMEFRNNLSTGSSQDFLITQVSGTLNNSNNMSSDSSGSSGLQGVTAADVYENLSPFDYHLKAGSPAIDAGMDASSLVSVAATDIDGVSVSGPWDIGADEFQTANESPEKPTITVVSTTPTTVDLEGSAFDDADDDNHLQSQWQVTTDDDTGFASPVRDVTSSTSLTTRTVSGLLANTDYLARVRYRDDSGDSSSDWSEWSDAEPFSTDPAAYRPQFSTVAPTLDGAPVEIGDGTTRLRNVFINTGEYATPFWIRPDEDNGRVIRVDALPRYMFIRCGEIEILSSDPN